ncbi:Uncharacterised protein [Vibrio cholerae]|nr:Uncharacterised protein [Vibrio cholerae]
MPATKPLLKRSALFYIKPSYLSWAPTKPLAQ